MSLYLITPPSAPVVSLDHAKAYLNVTLDDDDAVITGIVAGVADWLAGPEGWLGRSLAPQTLEVRLGCFPSMFVLPRPPLIGVEAVEFIDVNGDDQTVDPGTYLTFVGDDGMPRLAPKNGVTWPSTLTHPEAVTVRYRAGYPDADSPEGTALPAGLKTAILTAVARLYDNREAGMAGVTDPSIRSLFSAYRIYG